MEVRQVKVNTPNGEKLFIITQLERSEGGVNSEMNVKPLKQFRVYMIGLSFGLYYDNPVVMSFDTLNESQKAIESITYALNMNH